MVIRASASEIGSLPPPSWTYFTSYWYAVKDTRVRNAGAVRIRTQTMCARAGMTGKGEEASDAENQRYREHELACQWIVVYF